MNLTDRPIAPGPQKAECVCGCGLYGSPRVKVWRGETVGHVRACACPRCRGGRTKSQARVRENRIAKDWGLERSYGSGVISGYDLSDDLIEIEETAQVSLVRGLKRWWLSAQIQNKMARLLSRNLRSRAFVASWDGKAQLVVLPADDFKNLLEMARRK